MTINLLGCCRFLFLYVHWLAPEYYSSMSFVWSFDIPSLPFWATTATLELCVANSRPPWWDYLLLLCCWVCSWALIKIWVAEVEKYDIRIRRCATAFLPLQGIYVVKNSIQRRSRCHFKAVLFTSWFNPELRLINSASYHRKVLLPQYWSCTFHRFLLHLLK